MFVHSFRAGIALWAAFLVAGTTAVALAQQGDVAAQRLADSPRHHEWVDVPRPDGRAVRSFLAFPEVSEPALAVVVIHENKGLTDWVRSVADSLAEKGFVAIAPDLLTGAGPEGGNTDSFPAPDAATQAIYKLRAEDVMADLAAAADYARQLDAANGKVAAIGFCWGGGQSFQLAAHAPELAAALVFYGSAPDEATLARIDVPVFGFYGENDQRITGQLPRVSAAMERLGKWFEPVVYQGAVHGFLRAGEQPCARAADRDAAEAARARVLEILRSL
ncbi:MAG TPA: alpha/beta fold hydrolase [Lacipirellulaceae bacterium]|nr:alpha/beta fold hydrolase [Lacipirellulaceae bacterium]